MKAWQGVMAELLGWEHRRAMAAAARIECFRVRIVIIVNLRFSNWKTE